MTLSYNTQAIPAFSSCAAASHNSLGNISITQLSWMSLEWFQKTPKASQPLWVLHSYAPCQWSQSATEQPCIPLQAQGSGTAQVAQRFAARTRHSARRRFALAIEVVWLFRTGPIVNL